MVFINRELSMNTENDRRVMPDELPNMADWVSDSVGVGAYGVVPYRDAVGQLGYIIYGYEGEDWQTGRRKTVIGRLRESLKALGLVIRTVGKNNVAWGITAHTSPYQPGEMTSR